MRLRKISIFREQKAQVGVEYIIIVGLLLSMILIVYPYALKQNELNKALAAARDGAVYGASLRGMGFKGEGVKEVPEGIIKIVRVEPEFQDSITVPGKDWYKLKIYISAPDYIKDNSTYANSVRGTITNQALSYIYYTFNGNWPPGGIVPGNRVNTNYYSFTAGWKWV